MQENQMSIDPNIVTFDNDEGTVEIKLGIDFKLEETPIEPHIIDFEAEADGVVITTNIPTEVFTEDGNIDIDQLNLLHDPHLDSSSDDDADGLKLLFGSPDLKRGRSKTRRNVQFTGFGSDSDNEFDPSDFSPPDVSQSKWGSWYNGFNHSHVNHTKPKVVEAPKPEIYVLTTTDPNLTTYNVMHSLSGFHTSETKTIEV